jgi:cytidyltransferase-like protein
MNNNDKNVVVYGAFDDIRSSDIRFLQEASRFGSLNIFLWTDEFIRSATGAEPKFPEKERLYFIESIRFVHKVYMISRSSSDNDFSAIRNVHPSMWFIREGDDNSAVENFCKNDKIELSTLKEADLQGFPDACEGKSNGSSEKKVLVTGCFDWFHSGHIRFFEEVSEMGDLYVVVGNDSNVRTLKGENHPMFSQEERRYIAESIRYVKYACVSTGQGWLDAEPEIKRIKPDIYAVNEDGDRPEKQKYCEDNNIKYLVLKRLPKVGLPRRQSTVMRGF